MKPAERRERRIPLYARGGAVRAHAIVDHDDFEALSKRRWYLSGVEGYATTSVKGRGVSMHRLLLGLEPGDGLEGDHINGNRLDNRRTNLRAVDPRGNQQNRTRRGDHWSSRYRGVAWDRNRLNWVAHGSFDNRKYTCGHFDNELDAARSAEAFRRAHMPFAARNEALEPLPPCRCCMCSPSVFAMVSERRRRLFEWLLVVDGELDAPSIAADSGEYEGLAFPKTTVRHDLKALEREGKVRRLPGRPARWEVVR